MKSMRPPSAAIFFMTYFYRARGGHGPLGPPLDPLLVIFTALFTKPPAEPFPVLPGTIPEKP